LHHHNTLAAAAIIAASCVALPAKAQDAAEVSKVSLVAEAGRIRPGQTVLVGLKFALTDGWHIYWDGRNDTGFPPTADWTLPEGVTVGPMLWPAPHRYISPGNILDHVYEGEPTILIPITLDSTIVPGSTLTIEGEVEWLVCKDICLPGFGPVSIDLDVTRVGNTSAQEPPLAEGSPIARAAARLPKPVTAQSPVEGLTLTWTEQAVRVHAEDAEALTFYPAMASTSLVSPLEDAQVEGDTLTLRLASEADDLSTRDTRGLVGVLEVRSAGDQEPKWYLIDYGADGWRTPANAELISRVRDRVTRQAPQDP
jgi:thiol:disulfide interchange protein DsbD